MGRVRAAAIATAVVIAAGVACATAAPALADDVSREQAAALAEAAGTDPSALGQLEAVTSIDGRPADPAAALAGASGDELDARLVALSRALGAPGAGEADADAARSRAEAIVDGFPEDDARDDSAAATDGSSGEISLDIGPLWIPLLIVALIAGALIGVRLARNRERAGRLATDRENGEAEEDLDELNLRAQRAETSGEYEQALRLHYAIALRALQEAGAVPALPSVTPGRVSRELADPRADRLVGTFERVVYGGRAAAPDDAREARDGWTAVVRERGDGAEGGR